MRGRLQERKKEPRHRVENGDAQSEKQASQGGGWDAFGRGILVNVGPGPGRMAV